MRILFLSHYFPPEVNAPASRTYEHCKQWQKAGHQVTVVTCAPNHPRGELYAGYKNKWLQRENIDGIEVIRVWSFITANEGFIKRSLNYISFMLSCVFLCGFFGKADVVVSTSPQFFNGLAGYFVSRFKRIPWLLEIRDLWPDSILAVGATENKLIINILYWLERFVYQRCDRLVVVTDAFKKHIIGLGIPDNKISVVKNGVDLSVFDQNSTENTEEIEALLGLSAAELSQKMVCAYVGTHGMAHHLETIIQAAAQLKQDKNILFVMVGAGAERASLLEQKQSLELNNLIMLEQLPKSQMPALWSLVDVSLVLLRKSDLFKTVIPSKIFESMAMSKPIILGVEGEAAEIINNSGAGVTIEPENTSELVATIKHWQLHEDEFSTLKKNGPIFVAENFDRTVLANKMLQDIEAIKA